MRLAAVPSAALVLLVVLLAGRPVAADGYEETERRLKSAGIDEPLREAIHDAIRRGVACLRARQQAGTIVRMPGYVALAGLALRHAATPEGVEGAREAIRWIKRHRRRQADRETYTAGIVAMLLTADGSEARWNRAIHDLLDGGPARDQGYWGYVSSGGGGSNLSTAQFACLGLWAGERAGAPVAKKAWRRHLDALLQAQTDDGSWGYAPVTKPSQRSPSYPTGTFMGLADLVLAHRALEDELEHDPALLARVLLAEGAARAALRRHAAWILEGSGLSRRGGVYPYYRLFALEKACVFLDLEEVAGRRWYRDGARWLLERQTDDGGWSDTLPPVDVPVVSAPADPAATSFALLFLLRASESLRPVTPRPIDGGPVITPGDVPLSQAPPPAGPPPAVPLGQADALLGALEARLALPAPGSPRGALEILDAIESIHPDYRGRGGAYEAWCLRAEDLLLRASVRFVDAPAAGKETWHAVAIAALDTLATTDRRVARRLMRSVETTRRWLASSPRFSAAWCSAALDALRRLDAPALDVWLAQRCLSPDVREAPLTSAALTTLGGLTDLSGARRHAIAEAATSILGPAQDRSSTSLAAYDVSCDALVLVHRLAGPRAAGFPSLERGGLALALVDLERWWAAHGARSDPLWSD